jgi:hypothetical protein
MRGDCIMLNGSLDEATDIARRLARANETTYEMYHLRCKQGGIRYILIDAKDAPLEAVQM